MGGDVMRQLIKSKIFLASIAALIVLAIIDYNIAIDAGLQITSQFWTMLQIVPPIFLLIGLLDVWVPRETMIKLMGEESGLLGVSIAFLFGTLAAGPLVAAFPVAMIMLKKGARYGNVIFFLSIWASAKLPIIFFEISTLGLKFTVYSNLVLISFYLISSFLIERLMGRDVDDIYKKAEQF